LGLFEKYHFATLKIIPNKFQEKKIIKNWEFLKEKFSNQKLI
jgi:hypothetical protein